MDFDVIQIKPVALAPAYASNGANQKALVKIQENISADMTPLLEQWNKAGAEKTEGKRTLEVEPVVTEIKFIGGAVRFWAGAIAGSSAVIMHTTITEKETGQIVATPELFATAGAWSGSWTIGITDNLMLKHIADQLKDYLLKNYTAAIGGPTGAQKE